MEFINQHLAGVAVVLALACVLYWCWGRRWMLMQLETVLDGETYLAIDRKGRKRRLRLMSVTARDFGLASPTEPRDYVQELCAGKTVQVSLRGRDRHNRHLCKVRVEGVDLARSLVAAGLTNPNRNALSLRLAVELTWFTGKLNQRP